MLLATWTGYCGALLQPPHDWRLHALRGGEGEAARFQRVGERPCSAAIKTSAASPEPSLTLCIQAPSSQGLPASVECEAWTDKRL